MNLAQASSNKTRSAFEVLPAQLEEVFREGWTDNADVLSYLYTGTPALKTDFTRTGKRTYKGALNDGINSVTRYYINNFLDGYNHDCYDVATLKLKPGSDTLRQSSMFASLKLYFVLVIAMTCGVKHLVD